MRTKRAGMALVGLLVLAGWAACVHADVAATVSPNAITSTAIDEAISIGYRFYVDKPIVVTHLGLFDYIYTMNGVTYNGPGLKGTHTVALWRLPKTGGFVLERQVTIGPGAELSDDHAWVALSEPIIINPDTVPAGGFYERWMVGVWTPSYLSGLPSGEVGDALIFSPQGAVTFNCVQAGVVRFEAYTCKDPASTFAPPWPAIGTSNHYGVNFRYDLVGPKAEAGENAAIYTSEQALTTIAGIATHTVPGTPMQYQWLEGGSVLQNWADVPASGEANLSLAAPVAPLSIGAHTLTLEVKSGTLTASDTMVLSVTNTPPDAQPSPTYQVAEINVDPIIVTAQVADFDGDELSYEWRKDGEVLDFGTIDALAGGAVVTIPDLGVAAGDPRFPLGVHEVQLVVSDGVNPAITVEATVEVKDTTAPSLAPTPSVNLLWPPNHQLCPVTVWASAADNGGGLVTLDVSVQSSEQAAVGEQDWYVDSTDNEAGIITLRLRAERAGTDSGRVYTVTITATDASNNASVATVEIRVPHDRRKK